MVAIIEGFYCIGLYKTTDPEQLFSTWHHTHTLFRNLVK